MKINLLKSKIHRAVVTTSNLDYVGSISIDIALMQAVNMHEFEQVHVFNVSNGQRFITYAIAAPKDSGEICINGAAAHLVSKGDLIIVVAYGLVDESDASKQSPNIIHVNQHNAIIE